MCKAYCPVPDAVGNTEGHSESSTIIPLHISAYTISYMRIIIVIRMHALRGSIAAWLETVHTQNVVNIRRCLMLRNSWQTITCSVQWLPRGSYTLACQRLLSMESPGVLVFLYVTYSALKAAFPCSLSAYAICLWQEKHVRIAIFLLFWLHLIFSGECSCGLEL